MDSKRIAAARSRVYIIVTTIAALLGTVSATGLMPQYTAAEAKKHIGETATVVGKVDCIDHGRRHVDLIVGGCDLRKALLWIVLPDEASGPELDPETVRGVQIAVTGKIESAGGTPQITIKSTTQIQPRTALQINYIGRAYDKEQQGNIDGAIADLDKAIAHQPARRDEACQHLAKLKEQKGDWPGALAAYERLIGFDPNNSSSYYVRATAKKQHGDFEGAMADFTRAAELRSDPAGFTSIGDMRKERGDIAGANAEYDRAIALCDRQIAGTANIAARSPLGSDPYFSRGYARELKGDLDEAVADYTHAITNNPARAAMAYGARGNIRRSRGDLSGAIADYQHKYQITQYPDDKQKLEQVRAEARSGPKKIVVTQPSTQAALNEQSSNVNRNEVSPESIAEAFVRAYSGTAVDAVANLYAEHVDYTNSGVIGNAALRKQAEEYFDRWPARHWSLAGPVTTTSIGPSRQKVIFSATYDASNPQTNKRASGTATETLIVATDPSGAMKIVSQKEQTSKRSSSQPGKETSQGLGPNADDDQHANGGTLDEFMGDVTGTVVYADEKRGYIEIDREKHDGRGNFEVVLTGDLHTPKVGEKVSVHWYSCGGGSIHVSNRDRPHCADKIEKVGNAEAGLNRENSATTQQEFDPGSYFRLTTKWRGDAKSLDIVNDGKNNNRPILANTGNFSGQYWKIAPVGDGYYRLTTKWQGTAKSLDVVSDGKNNNQLILAKTGNYSGQYWKITPVADGYYRLTTQWQGAGKSLDIVNDGTNNNQPILAHTGNYSGQFWRLTAAAFSLAQAEIPEKLKSPDGKYSVEVVRGTEDSLVLSRGGEVIAKVPTSVGPVGSLFEALWSADGKYVAVNKQRSSRPGGDYMFIFGLPQGKVLRNPDDAFWSEVEEKASAYIDWGTGGKVFLTLKATGWGKGGLRFRLEAGFSQMVDRYFFDGTVEPLNLRMINDWKVSTANPTSSGNGDKPADSAIKQKLLGYWKFPKAVCYIAADGKMYVGPRKYATTTFHWHLKDGKFYWDNQPHSIVTLTDKKFVYREIGGYGTTFTLIRGTKEEVDPD